MGIDPGIKDFFTMTIIKKPENLKEFADENDNTVDKLKAYPEKIKIEENDKSFYKDYKAKANSNHEMYNFQTKSLLTKAYYHEIGYNNHC
jgi:hypothetical protein